MTRQAPGRRESDRAAWSGRRVLVLGAGVSGKAAITALVRVGARVTVADDRPDLVLLPAALPVPIAMPDEVPEVDLVVATPGARPDHRLLASARRAGVEVIGEPELAWRLRAPDGPPWLVVTGTNGKTTTVGMLASILRAAGLSCVACGNVGLPLVEVVTGPGHYDVIAVELSSFQLHRGPTIAPHAAAVLNVAPDHLDWHGSWAAYAAAKKLAFDRSRIAVFNRDDEWSTRLAAGHPHRIGFTLGHPPAGALGIDVGVLLDRAYGAEVELARVADVPLPGEHNLANALAAAALARSLGVPEDAVPEDTAADSPAPVHDVPPHAVADGLRGYRAGPHRNALLGSAAGVGYVDDSKATNPHAARASLLAYDDVVWIAGGLLKGAAVEELVLAVRERLRAVVLLGADRAVLARALARHAPDVPVVEVTTGDDGAMVAVVRAAAALARPGSIVLLAPAAASMDMFSDYAARGDAFAEAFRGLPGSGASP